MPTLVIHAPEKRTPSFEYIFQTGVASGYGLTPAMAKLPKNTGIVLLRKDGTKKRAEGNLVQVTPTGRMARGRQRYDIHIRDLKVVPYKNESLDRWGVQLL